MEGWRGGGECGWVWMEVGEGGGRGVCDDHIPSYVGANPECTTTTSPWTSIAVMNSLTPHSLLHG